MSKKNYLNNNLIGLKRNQKEAYEKLNNMRREVSSDYYIIENGSVEVLYYKTNSGNYIQYSSFFSPKEEAAEYLKNISFEKYDQAYVLFGAALGETLSLLLEKVDKRALVVCVEEDASLIIESLKRKDYSAYLEQGRLVFAIGNDEIEQNIIDMIDMQPLKFSGAVNYIFMPFHSDGYMKYSNKVHGYFQKYCQILLSSFGNCIEDTLVGLENYLANIEDYINSPGVNEIIEADNPYRNKPAILIASGPSLEKNIDFIKMAEGKALVLAADSAYKALNKRGIKADAIGAFERIKLTYDLFFKGETFDKDLVLAAPALIYPDLVKEFTGKKLLYTKAGSSLGQWISEFDTCSKEGVWCGASVSNMLFGLAVKLGCNPIILVGQDLSYSASGMSHIVDASGVVHKVKEEDIEVYVKDSKGNLLPSTNTWRDILDYFEAAVRDCNRTVINATEGGAFIKGTEERNLRDAIARYCSEDVAMLSDILEEVKSKHLRTNINGKNIFEKIYDKLSICTKLYDLAAEMCKDIKTG
ncbi:MAG: hypothetical protein K0Q99_1137, partial [Clostridia bacterium]|nr:hypothetical protein [Clostridia bacterium]